MPTSRNGSPSAAPVARCSAAKGSESGAGVQGEVRGSPPVRAPSTRSEYGRDRLGPHPRLCPPHTLQWSRVAMEEPDRGAPEGGHSAGGLQRPAPFRNITRRGADSPSWPLKLQNRRHKRRLRRSALQRMALSGHFSFSGHDSMPEASGRRSEGGRSL
jgi:hypothetical protein